jgi:hypothetical protein
MNLEHGLRSVTDLISFPFRDPAWQRKLLTGSLLILASGFLPLLPLLPALGYMARLMRDGARNSDASVLPEWTDWGALFVDGLRQFGVTFLMSLPAVAVIMLGNFVYLGGMLGMTLGNNHANSGPAGAVFALTMLIFFFSLVVGIALSMITWLILPPVLAHVAVREQFAAAFQVGTWWRILRSNLSGFLAMLILVAGLYLVIMFAFQALFWTMILCLVTPLLVAPVSFYVLVILGRLTGQAYGQGAANLQPAVEAPQPA